MNLRPQIKIELTPEQVALAHQPRGERETSRLPLRLEALEERLGPALGIFNGYPDQTFGG
jgi:hypothetical protein